MMSSSHSQFEDAVFQMLVPQLEAEGYSVFLHPSRNMLPPFLSGHQPDAIAIKGDRKLAIEVTSAGRGAEAKTERLRRMLSGHEDWELRIIYAPPRRPEETIPTASETTIEEHLGRVERAFDAMGPAAALLSAWAALEASARFLAPTRFEAPQEPARLLEALASDGYVTPDEADLLRQLGKLRNAVAHGRLDLTPSREQVKELIRIIRTLLAFPNAA